MMERISGIAALCAALALAGCASNDLDLGKYKNASLLEADVLPSKESLAQQTNKVIVFEGDDGNLHLARQAQAGIVLSRTIETLLSGGATEIVDRTLASRLKDEVMLADAKGEGTYSGPAVANYAIRSTITNAEYGAEYVPATEYKGKDGKVYTIPASYTHRAKVNANIQIYQIPSLVLIATVPAKGSDSDTGASQGGNHDKGVTMVRRAAEDAVRGARTALLNQFTIKGYVIEKKVDGAKTIFKVMLGSRQGAQAGAKVGIFTVRQHTNPLSGKVSSEDVPIMDAAITGHITENESWVSAGDDPKARQVRLGDVVKLKHEMGLFEGLMRKLK
ncbi:MAG: hypothetical protein HZB71_04205 [Betaproteobacteria bacterium]|nr:hypothetical protein [Betaproteobacteria bacterium]